MSLVVIGVNNRTMPLDTFEQVAVAPDDLGKALVDVRTRRHVSEAVVLSTCNRTEVYVYAEKFHGAYQDVRDFLAEFAQLAPEDFADHVYASYDDEAVRHLFSVTAGLESAVLGESEIQGQVKSAWETAIGEGATGTTLNAVFRHALELGKRVRTETAISRNITSVAHAAVVMADRHLGGLAGRRVLVLGAGDMGKGMATMLANADLARIVFANRSIERAQTLASGFDTGAAIGLDDLAPTLDQVDVLLTSTGAQSLMVDGAELAAVMERRDGQPLLIVDIAVPRDVDPSVAHLDAVTLLDMDDLRAFTQEGRREREAELGAARRVIDLELERFFMAQSARQAAPLVASFRQDAEAIRQGELERFSARLSELDDEQREMVDALTRAILGKLLHEPSVQLSDAAGTPRGDRLAEALRELFQL
ncbi:MAG: glutamyl-tRNA reductase [Acidimicrobiales bacterium]